MRLSDFFRHYNVSSFYHFTDTRNITSIRATGGLYSLVELKKRKIAIPAPGGNEWSHDADAIKQVDRYVHLCFLQYHPMEYKARKDGRIIKSLFLEIHLDILERDGVMFAPDVANKSGIPIYPVAEAMDKIDFEVLYNPLIQETRSDAYERLQLARKAEILVPDYISLDFIRNLPNG